MCVVCYEVQKHITTQDLNFIVVVICDPGVISLMSVGFGPLSHMSMTNVPMHTRQATHSESV